MIPTDIQVREFLLRRMAPQDAARFEEAILLEEGVAERLREEEFDLLDDYAAGRLGGEDRADVERHLLTSVESTHSLRMSRLLAREAGSRETPRLGEAPASGRPVDTEFAVKTARRRRWTGRYAAAGALLAAGIAAVAVLPFRERPPLGPLDAPPRTAGSVDSANSGGADYLAQRSAGPGPVAQEPAAPVLTLLAEASRGTGPPEARPTLHWRAGVASVHLQVEVPDPVRDVGYSIQVSDAAGRGLFSGEPQTVHTAGHYRFIDSVVPSAALGPGDRTISLRAADAAAGTPAQYSWRVVGALD
jgi:hypothetical protein